MSNMKNRSTGISANIKTDITSIPYVWQDKLPYIKDIRASWTANKSHGDKDYKSSRETLIKNNAGMCEEWLGEIGFLRYYLYLIDNGYTPRKTKIQRIDQNKGFSPDNIKIIIKTPRKKKETKKNNLISEGNTSTIQEVKTYDIPVNITNNMFLTMSEENRTEIAKAVLMAVGIGFRLIEGQKEIIFLGNTTTAKVKKAQ